MSWDCCNANVECRRGPGCPLGALDKPVQICNYRKIANKALIAAHQKNQQLLGLIKLLLAAGFLMVAAFCAILLWISRQTG